MTERSTDRTASLSQRVRYSFDNFMAGGGRSIFVALVVTFIVVLVVLSVLRIVVVIFIDGPVERGDGAWRQLLITFLEMTDPGSMTQDIETSPWFLVFTVLAGLIGIVMFSALIAFLTTSLEQRLAAFRKGHSKVLHTGHSLILGWNDRIVDILNELVLANESEDDAVVVILADRDKEEMDDHLAQYLDSTANTRVITRSGSPSAPVDLGVASVEACRSAIVLARCNASDAGTDRRSSDINVIKTILAVRAARPDGHRLNIVAEVFDESNRRLAESVAPEEVTIVDADDVLARIIVQTSRSVGVAQVYDEILSFAGSELYLIAGPWESGTAFREMSFHFSDGVAVGLRRADGELLMNPPTDTSVDEGDELVVLAQDDSTIDFQADRVMTPQEHDRVSNRRSIRPERQLLIGWTSKASTIVREFGEYVAPGSEIDVLLRSDAPGIPAEIASVDAELDNVELSVLEGDPLTDDILERLDPYAYEEIVILSQHGGGATDDTRTDAETVMILLLLRNVLREHRSDGRPPKLITEVLDSTTQALVAETGVYDFIVSNRLVSQVLAQLSEDPRKAQVFDHLFAERGAEIYCKPVERYLPEVPSVVTFGDLIAAGHARGEIVLGVKLAEFERDPDRRFGIRLVPNKGEPIDLDAPDSLVVLANDES